MLRTTLYTQSNAKIAKLSAAHSVHACCVLLEAVSILILRFAIEVVHNAAGCVKQMLRPIRLAHATSRAQTQRAF